MAAKPESPVEPFKRALAHAARSLAETADLEVVFSGEGPSLTGNRAVLPHPPRDLSSKEAARIRGLADQMALRLAHHDAAAFAKNQPTTPEGRFVVFDTDAGGGVRMETGRVTTEQALAGVASDPALTTTKSKCDVYRAFVRWAHEPAVDYPRKLDGACAQFPLPAEL